MPLSGEQKKQWSADWYAKPENAERVKKTAKTWYKKNREAIGARNRAKRTGCTPEIYNAKFQKQKGRCAICGRHQSEFKKQLAIDHDHETGELRDLLCGTCNNGLGCFLDDPATLLAAIAYLMKWNKLPKTPLIVSITD